MVKIAILGLGTVGSGVAELLEKNAKSIETKAKDTIELKYILDVRDLKGNPFEKKLIRDFSLIENDPEVQIVVETIGGTGVAFDFTKRALYAGKNVVTSNKEMVAAHGAEILRIARERNLNYLFEASVGGGIPIIRPLAQCLAANELDEIYGILNGTTNYILTRMVKAGLSFEDALREAQEKGYAEKNPESDIEGLDACRKICILSSLAYGQHIYPKSVPTEGITKITLEDVAYAGSCGKVIKLIGRSRRRPDGRLNIFVSPHLVSRENPISNIEDVFNGIVVHGDAIGEVMFYGRGAGKFPTASAVVADIIDVSKHFHARKYLSWDDDGADLPAGYEGLSTSFYIRASGEGAKAAAKRIFKGARLLRRAGAPGDEAAFLTGTDTEEALQAKISEFESKYTILSRIRVLN